MIVHIESTSPYESGVSVSHARPQNRVKLIKSSVEKLELNAELEKELAARNSEFENADPQTILRWASNRFYKRFSMATGFGPEGLSIIHFLAEIKAEVSIFNLDTGYQFEETLELRDKIKQKYGIEIELKRPELSVEQYEAKHGGPVYRTNPNQCCHDRKISVIRKAIVGTHAWASAIRRDQSPDRAAAPIVGWDHKFGLVKVNPLANWSKGQVWKLILDQEVPYNPLHDQGFPSIGCKPCTRAIQIGEDERAGRWSGTKKTECGLHSLGD